MFNKEVKSVAPKTFTSWGFSSNSFDFFMLHILPVTMEALSRLSEDSLGWIVDHHQKRALIKHGVKRADFELFDFFSNTKVDIERAEKAGMTSDAIEKALGEDQTSKEVINKLATADGTAEDLANNVTEEFISVKAQVEAQKKNRAYIRKLIANLAK